MAEDPAANPAVDLAAEETAGESDAPVGDQDLAAAEEVPAETTEETAVPAADPAPDTAVSSDSPTSQPLPENQDEIFLAASDSTAAGTGCAVAAGTRSRRRCATRPADAATALWHRLCL